MKFPKFFTKLFLGAGVVLLLTGCGPKEDVPQAATDGSAGDAVAHAELSNPSEFARNDEPVFFSFRSLGLAANDPRADSLVAPSTASQLVDLDADGKKDGLMVVLDFKPAETRNIEILTGSPSDAAKAFPKRTQAELSRKTGGEWQGNKYIGGTFENVQDLMLPSQHTDHSGFIRYEGPGIESDKVGYRIYLDWRNGFDIFGKKTGAMVLQDVGQDGFESYHHMSDWGMDILKVGDALGVGGYGYWDGDKVERVSKVDGWYAKVIENGNIYSALQIDYQGWHVADKTVDLRSDISMTAGSRLAHVRLKLSEALPNIAIGLVKHEGTELLQGDINVSGYAWTYVASYGKQSLSGENDNLGMAILFQRGMRDAQTEDAYNYVSVMEPAGGQLEYYFLAAWDGEPNGIKNREAFVAYLEKQAERLTMPPRTRLTTALDVAAKTYPVTSKAALEWSKKMADSELERSTLKYVYGGFDVMRRRPAIWEYTTGLQLQAYDDLAGATGNKGYAQAAETVIGSFVADDGTIHTYNESKYNIDSINSGKMLLRLYEETKNEKYKQAAAHLRHQLENHPRTSEGAFWHKKRYPYQLWLDGVYMGMPFLAHYSALFENGKGLEEAVNEFKVVRERLRDPATGLYFHAWDEKKAQEWADPETGLSRFFWSRGLGWLSMALVDTLDYIPEEKTALRAPLIDMIRELAPALIKVQDAKTGVWYQILDQPGRAGNYLESSGSSMFVYMLAKAVNKGYLPESYKEAALKGYEGILREFIEVHADGTISITNACSVAGLGYGRDGSYRYYMSEPVVDNDPKALGPFIMAGIEVSKMLERN